jgi:menaquinone-9 beta-reductase
MTVAGLNHFNVAICGSGPAGVTCALALENSGLSVALIDKSDFPRDKVCGDAIGGRVKRVMEMLPGSVLPDFLNANSKKQALGCKIFTPSGRTTEFEFVNPGFVEKRADFDSWLYNRTRHLKHIHHINGKNVIKVENGEEDVSIYFKDGESISADLVVGCDGAHSVTAKQLAGFLVNHDHYSGAVRAYYRNIDYTENSEMLEVHLIDGYLPGYFWIFPLPDNICNVGFGMLSRDISRRKIDLRKAMSDIISKSGTLSNRFKHAHQLTNIAGFGLPLGGKRRPISGNRYMLCGDAASLIDPITGEGIGNAMLSAQLAAVQIVKCFKTNDFSTATMKSYDKGVYNRLLPELKKNLILQRLLKRPWLVESLVMLAQKFPKMKQKAAGLI